MIVALQAFDTLGRVFWIFLSGIGTAFYAWPVTVGLLLLIFVASVPTAFGKHADLGRSSWFLGAPLVATIGIACVGALFARGGPLDASSRTSVANSAIAALFLIGLGLAITAVVRAPGVRVFVAALMAILVWYSLLVTACAWMSMSGECLR